MNEMNTIKSGDTSIKFDSTLSIDSEDNITSSSYGWTLSGATVTFLVKKRRGSVVFSANATIISASARTVRFQRSVSDGFPTTPGKYSTEWLVVFSDGSRLTFPGDNYNDFTIKRNLQ